MAYLIINGVISILVFIICMTDKIYQEDYYVVKCLMFGIFGISDALCMPNIYYNEYIILFNQLLTFI